MFGLLVDYASKLNEALTNSGFLVNNSISVDADDKAFKYGVSYTYSDILILGIGGSAMAGELLKSYLKYTLKTPPNIRICRGDDIPNINKDDTYIFVCSYSGNTAETLSSLQYLEENGMVGSNVSVITSGGKLAEHSKKHNYDLLEMPTGFMPRCAMWYSFFHLLHTVLRFNCFDIEAKLALKDSLKRVISSEYQRTLDYSNISEVNQAISLAEQLHNKIPLIYSAQERLEAVNLRWRGQIQENANQLAFGNYFPELNHNEINGWMFPADMISRFVVVVLHDEDDSSDMNAIISKSVALLKRQNISVVEITTNGKSLLERIISCICLADWTSLYLAILNNTDPTPIPVIQALKEM
jgi:glucose/mannose-6-phosphate isomerase